MASLKLLKIRGVENREIEDLSIGRKKKLKKKKKKREMENKRIGELKRWT